MYAAGPGTPGSYFLFGLFLSKMDFFKKEHFWTFWTKKNPKKSKKSKTVLAPQAPTKMIHDGIGGAAGAPEVAAGGRPAGRRWGQAGLATP